VRHILRIVNSGHGAVQRELQRLAATGVIRRNVQGRQVYYQANPESPVFKELKNILALTAQDRLQPLSKRFPLSQQQIATFCRKHHIQKLSLYGSVLREDFRPDSDIDVLVEFEEDKTPGFGIIDMEYELGRMVGRNVDLRTPRELSRYFREQVVREARVQYNAAKA